MPLIRRKFTASGSLVVPAGIKTILARGCGAGGGGGGGSVGNTGTNQRPNGGSGGGGAPDSYATLFVVPGETLTITIGAAGTGGTANNHGGYGGETIISGSTSGEVARFRGGGRGHNGVSGTYGYATGGGRFRDNTSVERPVTAQMGMGGQSSGSGGSPANFSRRGYGTLTNTSGGSRTTVNGLFGTDDGTRLGGIGGGGGGIGPFGSVAGHAGNGGNGNNSGAATAGATGTAGIEGGGGGGGGGGGTSNITPGAGGVGGVGGDGVAYLEWVE